MIRVLLADDQALLRMGLRMVIDSEDDLTVVGEASDGAEAIRLVEELRPEVVLMDVRMPNTDGIVATKHITQAHPEVRVIILTTFDLDQYVFEGLRAGASGFLLKDATPEQLTAAIRTVAGGEAVLAPTAARRVVEHFVGGSTGPGLADASPPPSPGILDELTDREREVFGLVARGLSNKEIAAALVVSEQTVKIHVGRILAKLGLRDRVQAVVLAREAGLSPPADGH